ncbi:hypothetical protein [Geobacter sp. DSM 9736]|uniref:hypothetical protein n=1 Tax=Geobacter sp. DSM 9736 TaxID=1277350 RepID=UPI0012FE1082|nr:hypothetical protein [Geobacter sp. DSM 9736]
MIENLHSQTYSFYRLFSSEAHPGLGAVVRYLQQNAEGIDIIDWGPTSKDLEITLISACTILFDSLSLMGRMFQVDISAIERFRPQIDEEHKFLKTPKAEDETEYKRTTSQLDTARPEKTGLAGQLPNRWRRKL